MSAQRRQPSLNGRPSMSPALSPSPDGWVKRPKEPSAVPRPTDSPVCAVTGYGDAGRGAPRTSGFGTGGARAPPAPGWGVDVVVATGRARFQAAGFGFPVSPCCSDQLSAGIHSLASLATGTTRTSAASFAGSCPGPLLALRWFLSCRFFGRQRLSLEGRPWWRPAITVRPRADRFRRRPAPQR
jgi:hypothetical protein